MEIMWLLLIPANLIRALRSEYTFESMKKIFLNVEEVIKIYFNFNSEKSINPMTASEGPRELVLVNNILGI